MFDRGHNARLDLLRETGSALRKVREKRLTARRYAIWTGVGLAALGATLVIPSAPLLVWNASASAPIGLYRVMSPIGLETGDMVVARLPMPMRDLAARRHYLPANLPLVKSVAAVAGDVVCARGNSVFVNGKIVATRRERDGQGRAMPYWNGCVILWRKSVLLLMRDHADSFDGRYFGPTPGHDVIGRARLLWRR